MNNILRNLHKKTTKKHWGGEWGLRVRIMLFHRFMYIGPSTCSYYSLLTLNLPFIVFYRRIEVLGQASLNPIVTHFFAQSQASGTALF